MLLGTNEDIADQNAISLQPLQDEVHPGCLSPTLLALVLLRLAGFRRGARHPLAKVAAILATLWILQHLQVVTSVAVIRIEGERGLET